MKKIWCRQWDVARTLYELHLSSNSRVGYRTKIYNLFTVGDLPYQNPSQIHEQGFLLVHQGSTSYFDLV